MRYYKQRKTKGGKKLKKYRYWVKSNGLEWSGTMYADSQDYIFTALRSRMTYMPIPTAVILIMEDKQP